MLFENFQVAFVISLRAWPAESMTLGRCFFSIMIRFPKPDQKSGGATVNLRHKTNLMAALVHVPLVDAYCVEPKDQAVRYLV